MARANRDPNVPWAYLNVVVFDKDFNYIDEQSGKVAITDQGKYVPGSSDYGVFEQVNLPQEITIQQAGYVLVYLSNETPGSEVYFDDLTIEHTTTPVVQKDDYYPFGTTFNSSIRSGYMKNRTLFIGSELIGDVDLDMYQLKYRIYRPELGRFISVDPISDQFVHSSTYAYAENDIIRSVDLEGLEKAVVTTWKVQNKIITKDSNTGTYTYDGGNWTGIRYLDQ